MNAISAVSSSETELAPLTRRREFEAASLLYRDVFGYDDRFSLNTKLMQSMVYAGGANMGAYTRTGELIGFVYGFPALGGAAPYLFSQAACVATKWRGRGIGSALKQAQMTQARAQGLTTMRWAFDPLNFRNARLNLDKLGARARWYKPDFYDDGQSDRLVVEWDGSPRGHHLELAVDPAHERFGVVQIIDDRHLAITAPIDHLLTDSIKERVSNSLRETLDRGNVAVQCGAVVPGVVAYICERITA